jgi:hypothetical protein
LLENILASQLLGCYIILSEIIVEVNRLVVEGRGGLEIVKVELDRQQSKSRWINNKSNFKEVDRENSKSKISKESQLIRGQSVSVR